MKTKIIQPPAPAPEIHTEILATAIAQIAESMVRINATRLTRKAIVVLIHDQSKLPKKSIEIVLNNLTDLEKDWLKKSQ